MTGLSITIVHVINLFEKEKLENRCWKKACSISLRVSLEVTNLLTASFSGFEMQRLHSIF